MNKKTTLLKNTVLYFFGSLGKGVSSILMVFIGSFFINSSALGTYDIVISTISLLQPIIIFQISDGIYRWLLDEENNSNDVISLGVKIVIKNLIAANLFFLIFLFFKNGSKINIFLILTLLNINCIFPVAQQITRGLKNHKIFALSGIFNALLIVVLSFVFVSYFNLGVNGLYLAQILSNILAILIMWILQKEIFCIDLSMRNECMKMEMISYSIMMIPNSINQWIMKALGKYAILFYLGSYSNGIFSVASRFSEILMMINSMFYSALVEQSVTEKENKDQYFTELFHEYSIALFSIIVFLIPFTKIFIKYFVGAEYILAWQYTPFLYLGAVFSAFAAFFGTGYISSKETKGLMKTSFQGAMVNVIINVLFMGMFGLHVAAISSCIAYSVMWLVRVKETKKFIRIGICKKNMALFIFEILLITILCMITEILDIFLLFFSLIQGIILNKIMVIGFIEILKRRIKS